jgi:S1-C subfamily serine protease
VIVNDIDEESPAHGVLAQGDVIQEINRNKISTVKDYQGIVSGIGKSESILLLIYRGGSSLFITLSQK